ncbi:sulfotransferase [Chloroflexia bacterium SDU3-3]|nr:sulfotransferase [Chloroflexia bacterium SDU3-3]
MMKVARADKLRIFLFHWFFTTLCGLTLREWAGLLAKHRFAVDLAFWPRAALITVISLLNTLVGTYERLRYGASYRKTVVRAPIFVLGHYRSGTTMLHRILVNDRRLAYPTTWQALNPHTFLTTESFARRCLQVFFPRTRLVDNVRPGVDAPFEDEAVTVNSLHSYLLRYTFPREASVYDPYLTFRGVRPAAVAAWKRSLVVFYKKLTWRYQQRQLILKSPMHTGRIKLLLEMFPDARFIHIYRNPYSVFKSTQSYWAFGAPGRRLQHEPKQDIDRQILDNYKSMFDAYFEEKSLIPEGHLYELRYEDLERDPMAVVRDIYQSLGLPDFAEAEGALQQYFDAQRGYRKNKHAEIDPAVREVVVSEWRRNFETWGYDTEEERRYAHA